MAAVENYYTFTEYSSILVNLLVNIKCLCWILNSFYMLVFKSNKSSNSIYNYKCINLMKNKHFFSLL